MTLVARDLTAAAAQKNNRIAPVHVPAQAPAAGNTAYRNSLKRVMDLLLVVLALPVWLPIVLLGALAVATDGHNPFYRQKRLGRGGQVFWLWKLRTMVPNADAKLEAYLAANPEARAEWDVTQKLKHDPRITVVGRVLRKTSLDELPQLINVLTGEMSIVGPRPMMVCQQDMYHGESYYTMRPGLTGLWQVSARNNSDFAHRVRFDDRYARTVSLSTDLGVMMRTVGVVLRGTGY